MSIGDIATSGMNAAMSDMEVVSNNIANSNTTGFKKSFVNFADLYPAGGGMQPGLGVTLENIGQDFSQGSIQATDSPTDLSIANSSFFIVRDPATGAVSYTRAGRFTKDDNGYITNGSQRLQMFPAANGVVLPSASLVDMQIPNATFPPTKTANVGININLDSASTVPPDPFSASDSNSFNYRTDQTIFDSLGNSYQLSLFYIKSTSPADTWTVQTQVNGASTGSVGTLTFSNTGALTATSGLSAVTFSPLAGAVTPQSMGITFTGTTQVAGPDSNRSFSQDGFAAGQPTGYAIDNSGNVTMSYSNSQTQVIGQVALASFASPNGLQYMGNQSWTATSASGTAIVGQPNGTIKSNSLEGSNVNLTQEMVDLLNAQHNFQANAQVEQAYNQVMETIIKL